LKTAYLNLTETERRADLVHKIGKEANPDDFESKKQKAGYELYKIVEELSHQKESYNGDKKKAFREAFVDVLVESTIRHHEPAHEFFPYNDNPRIMAENERKVSELQVKHCPQYKAWVEFCRN